MIGLLFRYKLLLLFIVLIIIVFLMTLISSVSQPENIPLAPTSTTPTPVQIRQFQKSTGKLSPLQQTIIKKTTESEIQKTYGIEKIRTLPNNTTEYILPSSFSKLPQQIIVKNGVVVYEEIVTPKDPTKEGFVRLSDFTRAFGTPDSDVRGSKRYGWWMHTYIYPGKGIAVLADPETDIIYEIRIFVPTTLEEYIKQYGNDLDPNATESKN